MSMILPQNTSAGTGFFLISRRYIHGVKIKISHFQNICYSGEIPNIKIEINLAGFLSTSF